MYMVTSSALKRKGEETDGETAALRLPATRVLPPLRGVTLIENKVHVPLLIFGGKISPGQTASLLRAQAPGDPGALGCLLSREPRSKQDGGRSRDPGLPPGRVAARLPGAQLPGRQPRAVRGRHCRRDKHTAEGSLSHLCKEEENEANVTKQRP